MKKLSERALKALAVTCEALQTDWSRAGLELVAHDLAGYPEEAVLVALERCRRELRGKLFLGDIIARIPGQHPGVEEAWSIVAPSLCDERLSVVWTHEMARAFGAAIGLAGDKVAARMAFKEVYLREVSQALNARPVWFLSPGFDKAGRELAIVDALEKGRIAPDYARLMLPHHLQDEALTARLMSAAQRSVKALPAPKA